MELKVEYRPGTKSSRNHLSTIGSFLSHVLGCQSLFPGSLNVHAATPVTFSEPARVRCGAEDWLFVPVIIKEAAVGLAARRPPPDSTDIIEVFACDQLAPKLGLEYFDEISIRLLSGRYLPLAA